MHVYYCAPIMFLLCLAVGMIVLLGSSYYNLNNFFGPKTLPLTSTYEFLFFVSGCQYFYPKISM